MPKHKSKQERLVEQQYISILNYMTQQLGNDVTFNNDLQKIGIKILGNKFKGVYPSDKIPKLNKLQPYAILNLDNSNKPGSHWIAIAYDDNNDNIVVYDSFGRNSNKIIPNLYNSYGGRVIDTDNDVEQRLKEDNCGQRSLAWLVVVDNYGFDNAILI